jgi:hypothetical protein
MKRNFLLIAYLLSTTVLQAAPIVFECPCRPNPKPPQPQFYSELFCGCGCGGGGADHSDDIPPDQD